MLATEHGAMKVILEVDSMQVVNLSRSDNGIRELFTAFDVSFVHREGTEAARTCACMPVEASLFLSWSGFQTTRTFGAQRALS